MKDTIWEKIRSFYWKWWPYSLRPSEIRYWIVDNLWYRHRTVKPRTLKGQGFIDCTELLPHCMFEILSRFVENELPGYIDWVASDHNVETKDGLRNVYDVWQDMYVWWHKRYLPMIETRLDDWAEHQELHCKHEFLPIEGSVNLSWDTNWDSPESEEINHRLFKEASELETKLEEELEENLILLVKTRIFLWT